MDPLDTLKAKYASALNVIAQTGTHLTHLHVQGGKLTIQGAAPSELAKNQVWTAIKAVDATYSDVHLELAVDPSLPSPPQAQTYTVVAGDSLSKIAKHFYGNANSYMKIYEANRDQLTNPDVVKVGQVLRIPPQA